MPRLRLLLVLLALGAACAAARVQPQVKVIGRARRHLVVQIDNPSNRTIVMASFDWTLSSQGRRIASGTLPLRGGIRPGGKTVVELPVAAEFLGEYHLEGQLRAEDRASWRVNVTGRFQ
jgi:hypothetical protein